MAQVGLEVVVVLVAVAALMEFVPVAQLFRQVEAREMVLVGLMGAAAAAEIFVHVSQ